MSTDTSHTISEELNNAIALIGDAHILCIISSLEAGCQRFNELQRSVNGLNPTTLSDRLKKLEKEQIVMRREDAVSVVYELTQKGRGILPIIKEIKRFAHKYFI